MNTKRMRLMLALAVLAAGLTFGNAVPASAKTAPPSSIFGCTYDGVHYAPGAIRVELAQVNGETGYKNYQCQQYVQEIGDGFARIAWRWVYIGFIPSDPGGFP
jgi:hypothetical protein